MTERIVLDVDSEDVKNFEAETGMKIVECIKILMNSLKYGGKLEYDPFWSDENIQHLRESIREFNEGKVVTFTAEEWEKFVNEQEI